MLILDIIVNINIGYNCINSYNCNSLEFFVGLTFISIEKLKSINKQIVNVVDGSVNTADCVDMEYQSQIQTSAGCTYIFSLFPRRCIDGITNQVHLGMTLSRLWLMTPSTQHLGTWQCQEPITQTVSIRHTARVEIRGRGWWDAPSPWALK